MFPFSMTGHPASAKEYSYHHFSSLTKPLSAISGGGIYHYNDGSDTPDVVSFILDHPENVTVTCYMANQAFRTKSRVTWNSEWDLPEGTN